MEIAVDLGAIARNLEKIRSKIGKRVGLTFMVKADAYNHGAERVAPAVERCVDAFGVATGKEGAYLRLLGIEKRILVTAFTEEDFRDAEFYRLTPVFGTLREIRRFARRVQEFDVAIDCGMNRYGLIEEEIPEAARFFEENGLAPRGISTHFPDTDPQKRDAEFDRFLRLKRGLNVESAKLHAANSDAALRDPKLRLDEARIGIAGYGGISYGLTEPAMRVTAKIAFVKTARAGDRVGYDGRYEMPGDGELAFVRAGYYDGVPRSLRGAALLVGGKPAAIAGNVSMDSFMLDVTGLGAEAGDEVEFISNRNPAEALAKAAGTIPYEILTNLKGRNRRKYYGEIGDPPRDPRSAEQSEGRARPLE